VKKSILTLAAISLALVSANATPVNVSGTNGEQTLQQIVGSSFDVNTAQLANDSYFTATSLSGKLVIELAGYAPNNAFGIYKKGSPGVQQQLFAGTAVAGNTASINVDALGWYEFGFYIRNIAQNFIWYSDATLNAAGQKDHFVTFKGAASPAPATTGITLGANDYLIGIEDLNLGDWDYNDMVVKVSLVPRVPDTGATVALMGLGLAGLAILRRRK
jgi:hypothetical protein